MTTEKKVKVLGEEITIRFSMAVEIAFEDITGEPFSIQSLDKQKNSVALCMAAIIVNNPDTKITMEQFIKDVSAAEYTTLVTYIVEAMTEWMKIPAVIPEEPKSEEAEQEDAPKN